MSRGYVPCSRGSIHSSRGSVHCSGGVYIAPGALCIARSPCALLQGLHTLLQGLCTLLWGSVGCSRGSAHCSGAAYTAPGPLRIAVILQLCLKNAPAAEAAAPSRPESCRLQQAGCITATSQPPSASPRRPLTACVSGHTSISQGPAGPAPMAFCSCSACLAPRGPSSPGCRMHWAGAAHPHQQPGPGSIPACLGEVGSLHPGKRSAATGNVLLYIDPFGVVFSICIGNRGLGFVWFFLKDSLLLECGFSFLQLPFNYL